MKPPPRGLAAIPWRLPIYLYRLGLGFLLGQRFMLLTHTGRVSGLPRQAVIEVLHRDPQTNSWYAASGFGEKSHWFRNIMKTPQVTIQVGRRTMRALARRLPAQEGEAILREYARAHPRALRQLSRLMGLRYDGTPESLRSLAQHIPIVQFRVTDEQAPAPRRMP